MLRRRLLFVALLVHSVHCQLYQLPAGAGDCIVKLQTEAQSPSECSGGYLLRVEWYGRFGNHLLQLAHVLHLAQQTKSEVLLPPKEFLNRSHWDFRTEHTESCQIAVTSWFFHKQLCPPLLDRTVFPATAIRNVMLNEVLPVFQFPIHHSRDSVVVHIRSGDIFSPVPSPHYTQPPLAFYQSVLQLPELASLRIVLCTEDHQNPVVAILEDQFKDRLTLETDYGKAVSIILGARHLVLGQSSFSELLGLMAPNLASIYIPFCVGREDLYVDKRLKGWNLPGYCYEYDDYIPVDGWYNSAEQREMMVNFSSAGVHRFELPMD